MAHNFFRYPKHRSLWQKLDFRILLYAFVFAFIVWAVDVIMHHTWFCDMGSKNIHPLYSGFSLSEFVVSLLGLIGIIAFGLLMSVFYAKRVRVENQLMQVNRELNSTLDSIGDAVICTNSDGRITRMNPVAAQLTEYDSQEALGKVLTEVFVVVNAHTRNPVPNPIEMVIERNGIIGLANHTVLISASGKEYQIADSAAPIRDALNEISGVVLVFRDVTDEYNLREKVKKSETQLKVAQQITKTGSWEFHLSTGKVEASDEARRIYGIETNEEITITDVQKVPLLSYRRKLDQSLKKLIAGEDDYEEEFKIKQKGTGLIRDIYSVAVYDSIEQKVIGTIQDISGIKQTERQLKAIEQRFRMAIEGTNDGLWDLDLTNQSAYISERYAVMLGYQKNELPETIDAWVGLLHPDDVDDAKAALERYLNKETHVYNAVFRM
ncbi:MAG: PAS domain S-box protein, partial [Salinivirgaceae bacterium]